MRLETLSFRKPIGSRSKLVVIERFIEKPCLHGPRRDPVGFGITDAARRYLAPLIVGEAYPPFKNGLPDYVKLQNVAAPKKLTTEFVV